MDIRRSPRLGNPQQQVEDQNDPSAKKTQRFPPHYTKEEVERGIEEKSLFRGEIRIPPQHPMQAFITNPTNPAGKDVMIKGVENRNRALQGDLVVVEILPEEEWVVLHDVITKHLAGGGENADDIALKESSDKQTSQKSCKKNESSCQSNDDVVVESNQEVEISTIKDEMKQVAEKIAEAGISPQEISESDINKTEEKVEEDGQDPAEEDGQGPEEGGNSEKSGTTKKKRYRKRGKKKKKSEKTLPTPPLPVEKKKVVSSHYDLADVKKHSKWEGFVHKTAKVVHIEEKRHNRKAAGLLSMFRDRRVDFARFRTLDHGIPDMKIPKDQCPPEFFNSPQNFSDLVYVAQIKEWEHITTAEGNLLRLVGHEKSIDVQNYILLLDFGTKDFSESDEACLPRLPFDIPLDEIERRQDLRHDCVFTIDPTNARDLDDAVSVTKIKTDRFKVAVHISDVPYFVKEGSDLDQTAKERATSLYLVQGVIPMLPRTLSEDLCSLNPNLDRLTYTVEWTLNSEGEILSEWFGQTIIKSCCQLTYEDVQGMMDQPSKYWKEEELPQISKPWTPKDLSQRVNILNALAKKLRQKREENGAVSLDVPKLSILLDPEAKHAMGYQLYKSTPSTQLIEELMLLANMSVAKKIYSSFPDLALLRSHKPPKQIMTHELQEFLKKYDIFLDFKSSKTLAESLAKLKGDGAQDAHSMAKTDVVLNKVYKTLELATYLCPGTRNGEERKEELHHYALCAPLYTHFTSPIRRYPDIFVQRMLDAAVKGKAIVDWKPQDVESLASYCTDLKIKAKKASENSVDLYLAQFIKNSGPIQVSGVVTEVQKNSVAVLIHQTATVKRMKYEDIRDKLVRYPRLFVDNGKPELKLEWKPDVKTEPAIVQYLRIFSPINLTLCSRRNFDYYGIIERES